MRKFLTIISFWKITLLISALLLCFQTISYADNITLEWDASPDTDLVHHYVIYWGTSSGPPYAHNSGPLDKSITTYIVIGLDLSERNFFAAKVFDTLGRESDYCDEIDIKPPQITSPPTVTSITGSTPTGATATIEWHTDERSTSVVNYRLLESDPPVYTEKTIDYYVTSHSVTLTELEYNKSYLFYVSSTDIGGVGPPGYTVTGNNPSNIFIFQTGTSSDNTDPEITSPPTVTAITDTTATIEWQTDEPSDSAVQYDDNSSTWGNYLWSDYVTNHSITLSGLEAGKGYHFQVSSTDVAGNGPDKEPDDNNPSTDGSFTTDPEPDIAAPQITSPPTVTNITGSTAVIEWETDEPSNSMVQYRKGSTGTTWGGYELSENDAGMVTTHSVTLTGLITGNYWFMVGSTDAFGNGPGTSDTDNNPSAQQNFTIEPTPDTAAPVISNVIVAGKTDTTAIITWQTDEPSNSMVQYQKGPTGSTWGSYELSENDAGMVTSHTVTLTGLAAENTYYFRVGSTDAAGNGPDLNSNATNPSTQQPFTTDVSPDADAPVISDVTVAGITDTTAVITWTTDEPSNSQVQYQEGPDGSTWGSYDSAENDVGMVTSHSVTLTGLKEGTLYHFRVGSSDALGNGPTLHSNATNPSADGNFTTTVPDITAPVISVVTVESTTDTTAIIEWETDEPSNTMVQYGTSSSSWGSYQWRKNNSGMVSSHSITITGLTGGNTYYFSVGSNDALGNGPDLHSNATNPSDQDSFTTNVTPDTDPPSIIGYSIDYVNDIIDVTYDEANMQNANIEANYSFSPTLYFRTAGGSDDITYIGSNTYRLFMASIPQDTIFTLQVTGITDEAGNPVPNDPPTIIDIPPSAVGIVEVIPHHNAGITDSARIPNNTSFAARIEDSDGIDTTDLESIKFTIDDGVNIIYEYTLGNSNVVRVVQLDPNETEDNVTKLWVVYDRSTDDTYGNAYPFGSTVTISVDAKDRNQNWINQGVYCFKVETEAQHNNAVYPPTGVVDSSDPDLEGSYIYDTGAQLSSGQLAGAKILYDSNEPITPIFGPMGEIPPLNISGVDAVGVPMNLQPPTVFDTPVKIFIPCPGYPYASTLSIYRYSGTSWVLACDASGTVQSGGEGWMKPGSRVDHNNGSPSTIEIQVYHFTGVQGGSPSGSVGFSTDAAAGGGCFIATATYGSHMDRHVKILSEFRDRYLLTNSIGRGILEGYYKFSPPVADYLQQHPFARASVRYALIPITGIAYISLSINPLALLFAFIFLLLTGVYCARRLSRPRNNSIL